MPWPQAIDYSAAIQNPAGCFADADLGRGTAATDAVLGLPLSWSGNFATVYKLVCPDNQVWAIKCFTRPVTDLRERYRLISQHLRANPKRFAVEFHYLPEGIRVHGTWYPVLKMRWVEGFTLNEFLRDHVGNAALLEQLAQLWFRLSVEMREVNLAHGDLQHGNVMLVPGRTQGAMVLRLIDYDGTWVPALAGRPTGEVGHCNYQHPQRAELGTYDRDLDRFAHLVIYTALRALPIGGKALWQRHDNGENLLFRESDFKNPGQSKLFAELLALEDVGVQTLASHLVDACLCPMTQVPLLSDLVTPLRVKPLSAEQLSRVRDVLPPEPRLQPSAPPDWLSGATPLLGPLSGSSQRKSLEATGMEIPLLDAVIAHETTVQVNPLSNTRMDAPPIAKPAQPARPRDLPWVKPPAWFLQAGLAEDSVLMLYWPVTLGVALALPLCLLVLGLVLAMGRPDPVPQPVPTPPALWAGKHEVVVRAGRTAEVGVTVARHSHSGVLTVRVEGLPDKVWCDPVRLPGGLGAERVTLRFQTTIATAAVDQEVSVQLLDGVGRKLDEKPLVQLQVEAFRKPAFHRLKPESLQLKPGQMQKVIAQVEPNGNTDAWHLRLEPLSRDFGLRQRTLPSDLAKKEVGLQVEAPAQAVPGGRATYRLLLLVDNQECDTREIQVSIEDPGVGRRIDLRLPEELRFDGNGTGVLEVQLRRTNWEGRVTLRLVDAPVGVTPVTLEVPAGNSTCKWTLEASRNAGEGRHAVRVVAMVDGQAIGEQRLQLLVGKAAARGGRLTVPEPREVSFATGDGLTLAGTYYPSERKREAACVLMLHDLWRSTKRSDASWDRLARTLQRDGWAVLTFDFRGYGSSPRGGIPQHAALLGPNRMLHDFIVHKEESSDSKRYLPWLVQDVVAARLWLDLKHDEGEHNSRNLFVVAAGEAAQLSLVWMVTETVRVKKMESAKAPKKGDKKPTVPVGEPEGKDLRGAVWLDPGTEGGPLLGDRQVWPRIVDPLGPSLPQILCLYDKTRLESEHAANALRRERRRFLQRVEFAEIQGRKVSGGRLLNEDHVEHRLLTFLQGERVRGSAVRLWVERNAKASRYVWRTAEEELAKAANAEEPQLLPLWRWGYQQLKVR